MKKTAEALEKKPLATEAGSGLNQSVAMIVIQSFKDRFSAMDKYSIMAAATAALSLGFRFRHHLFL